jgi:uncharacterized RDD family membrane protein YckC
MNFLINFLTISLYQLNLFSFVLGYTFGLTNTYWGRKQWKSWLPIIIYVILIAFYYFLLAEFPGKPDHV